MQVGRRCCYVVARRNHSHGQCLSILGGSNEVETQSLTLYSSPGRHVVVSVVVVRFPGDWTRLAEDESRVVSLIRALLGNLGKYHPKVLALHSTFHSFGIYNMSPLSCLRDLLLASLLYRSRIASVGDTNTGTVSPLHRVKNTRACRTMMKRGGRGHCRLLASESNL